ncbi:hypothetical protein GCM10010306_060340 [Streptomyces umbrinus]|nr:hypothetical protein GCM10010306_060340 [Streptomyces umbrinus]
MYKSLTSDLSLNADIFLMGNQHEGVYARWHVGRTRRHALPNRIHAVSLSHQ